ncbi:MAG TPA: cytochrome c oxidase assembly protein [Gemmatimonadales bacterium]
MTVQWWCSATGQPWTWGWKAYPGVWLFVGALAFWYLTPGRRYDGRTVAGATDRLTVRPSQLFWFFTGLLAIWLALDWPIGALGAGYLASFHTASYILLSLVAPPCLILGVPEAWVREALQRPGWGPALRLCGRPWFGLSVFNVVVLVTHVPGVLDSLMVTQLGALLVDLGWLAGGLLLWFPVMGPSPEVVRLKRPLKLAYLFASTLAPTIPSAFLTFAQYPLYSTYELAPRVFERLTAQEDQQVAGLLMKLVGDLPVWFGFGVIFFRWAREDERQRPPVHPDALRGAGLSR